MAENNNSRTNDDEEEEEEEDYLGDLSQFLPPEVSQPSKPIPRKVSTQSTNYRNSTIQTSKKKTKHISWQEQLRLKRERQQHEEDERTVANMDSPIPQSNIGFKMLKQMGYTPGLALGKEGSGQAEPVGLEIRRSRAGIGREDPLKEKRKKEEVMAEQKKQKVEELLEEFGSRQKSQWRNRRVVVNFEKAKRALDQLENKEITEPVKNEDEEVEEEEEEEEEITEEDLHDILMRLRNEYEYCLFCGCRYESAEALLSNCPGINEDDH